MTWHTLRHTFASPLVTRGVDIVTVKEPLGDSTITLTMRYAYQLGDKAGSGRDLEPR